jgi:hypothetical protein
MKTWMVTFISSVAVAFAAAPRFTGPTRIYDGGSPIDVGYYGAPCIYDWDGDGKKDMIVGQLTGGYIRFYRNVGTDAAPSFSGFSYLSASGSQIRLTNG